MSAPVALQDTMLAHQSPGARPAPDPEPTRIRTDTVAARGPKIEDLLVTTANTAVDVWLFPAAGEQGGHLLELQLQCQLPDPWRAGRGDLPERGTAHVRIRIAGVHMVESVEELGAELHLHPLAHTELLGGAHIPVEGSRPTEVPLAPISERTWGRKRELRPIQPAPAIRLAAATVTAVRRGSIQQNSTILT